LEPNPWNPIWLSFKNGNSCHFFKAASDEDIDNASLSATPANAAITTNQTIITDLTVTHSTSLEVVEEPKKLKISFQVD
jgi:hypothetical protein